MHDRGWRIADTVTNLAYLFAGLVALGDGASMLGAALVVLAIGSGTYHWTRTPKSSPDAQADWTAIYAVLIALIGYILSLPSAITFGAFALLAAFYLRLPQFETVGLLAAGACIALAFTSILAAGVAAGLFLVSLYARNRFPWGHACWHLGTSGAVLVALVA